MTTRQEIYDRIRDTSRNEVILEEMIRLGFWKQNDNVPQDPATEIKRAGELERQLRSLTVENTKLKDVDALRKAARKERMKESRERQKETKEKRLAAREQRATAWKQRKQTDVTYLGQSVSNTLNHRQSDAQRLTKNGLPVINDVNELAAQMQTTVGELRFLSFSRRTSTVTHYQRFGIPKKTGGVREISAPMPRLKLAQTWILLHLLEKIELHRAAHGFRRGRSIVTNAKPHLNSDVVINVDLENFFPTLDYKRVLGLFRNLGFSGQVSTLLALICSEPEVDQVELDNHEYYVAKSERRLPQGAPSSPAITNIICRGLDARLSHIADKLGFTYTRYADDITFSGSGESQNKIGQALRQIKYAVEQEGFQLNESKTRIQRKPGRQEVTGLVVNNEKVSVSRDVLRRFRATLKHIERDGPAGKHWGPSPHVMSSIEGFANFVAMVDEEKGRALQAHVRAIHTRHGRGPAFTVTREQWTPKTVDPPESATASKDSSTTTVAPKKKKKPWWKFW
jgi:RNA-directed DNA polymerase